MSAVVTSLQNERVKAARALHMRKAREDTGLFLAEGLKFAVEAMELGFPARTLMYAAEGAGHPLLRRLLSHTREHGGVSTYAQRWTPLAELDPSRAEVWVALAAVRDPGNLGTVIRTADAAGGGGVLLVGDTCDPWSVEAVRATMGSIFAVPLFRATDAEFLDWRRGWPGAVVGTLLTATQDHRAAAHRRPTLLLMGNEAQGLSPELAAACDTAVKIPMRGRADSLNLAVATGIMIYAATG